MCQIGAFYYGNIAWDPEISHFLKGEKFKNISQKNMRNFSEKNENLKSSKKQYVAEGVTPSEPKVCFGIFEEKTYFAWLSD